MNKTQIGNIVGSMLVASLIVGGSIAGATINNQVQADAQAHHVLVAKNAKIASDQAAADAQAVIDAAAAQAVIDAAAAQKVLDDAAAAKAAADALAAQRAAAAQAAAQAVVAPVAKTSAQHIAVSAPIASGPIKCPAGSSANSGDAGNDTSCFPDICFHITLPDAAHPECVTAFKP